MVLLLDADREHRGGPRRTSTADPRARARPRAQDVGGPGPPLSPGARAVRPHLRGAHADRLDHGRVRHHQHHDHGDLRAHARDRHGHGAGHAAGAASSPCSCWRASPSACSAASPASLLGVAPGQGHLRRSGSSCRRRPGSTRGFAVQIFVVPERAGPGVPPLAGHGGAGLALSGVARRPPERRGGPAPCLSEGSARWPSLVALARRWRGPARRATRPGSIVRDAGSVPAAGRELRVEDHDHQRRKAKKAPTIDGFEVFVKGARPLAS